MIQEEITIEFTPEEISILKQLVQIAQFPGSILEIALTLKNKINGVAQSG